MNIYFKDFIYLFLERGEVREKERERNTNVWLPLTCPPGDLARNPGLCPDWESNWQPSGSQPMLNLLSYPSQGLYEYFKEYQKIFSTAGQDSVSFELGPTLLNLRLLLY